MHRTGVPGPEPGDLLVDGVHVALGQLLADAPHVPLQRQLLVAELVGDLPQLRPDRQPLRRRIDAPQRVHAGAQCVPEGHAVTEPPGHGDRVAAEGE